MQERRTVKRMKPYYYLRVYEKDSGDYAGSVIDISRNGMRLVSEDSREPGSTHRFEILLPGDSILGDSVELLARARWSTPHPEEPSYECGFEFAEPASDGILTIAALIKDLEKRGQM